ncbi:MAG: glycosyltransferase family 4 protein [Anaerolineaceae bacterium]|nr:glycosyltransferase family 4 protein [Anaerolineaceae bacterium]
MRILTVHNRYLLGGGEDVSHLAEVALLRSFGHLVDEMVEDNRRIAGLGRIKTALRTIWSHETYCRTREILKETPYDILLVQNFFPLISPSVYYAAAREGVPVIQFIRNYRLVCLNAYLLRKDRICEDCVGRTIPWPGVYHACYRESHSASLVVAAMLAVHRFLNTWNRKVQRYVVLTKLAKEKLIAGGISSDKIAIRPNYIYPDPGIGNGEGQYALFVGRLSLEKGVKTLLDAWAKMPRDKKLILVGDGPLSEAVRERARLQPNLETTGTLTQEVTQKMIRQAKFVVFPSTWYEGMPRTIIEAFAAGTPVIASNLGAMAGMVEHGKNGFLFPAGDGIRLAELAVELFNNDVVCTQMRLQARQTYDALYSGPQAYESIMQIVQEVLKEMKDEKSAFPG